MIKTRILQMNTQSSIKKREPRSPVGYRTSSQIGIVFSTEDLEKHKAIKSFIKKLEEEGKQVQVLAYLGKGKENHEFLFDFFGDDALNFWGKVTSEQVTQFVDNKFDFVFHLDSYSNVIIDNLLANSKSLCRIGIQGSAEHQNSKLYEVLVKTANDIPFHKQIEEVYFYASKIM